MGTSTDNASPNHYDVIVLGVGGMGSATICELAERGLKVLGVDRFSIPNQMGSSHGATRIIRMAYYQEPYYVKLVQQAYDLWRKLEEKSGEHLLAITGSIDAGYEDSEIFLGSKRSCEEHNLPHEILNARQVAEKFPGYNLPDDIYSVYQPDGGVLFAEKCIDAFIRLAKENGAEIHDHEQVLDFESNDGSVKVITDKGEYFANRLVVTAGPWFLKILKDLPKVATPERQVVGWFEPNDPEVFSPNHFPVFNLKVNEGHYYGFPVFDQTGFKFGKAHHLKEVVDPDNMNRDVSEADEQLTREGLVRFFPEAAGKLLDKATCIYTNTPDEHFVIDLLPGTSNVYFAGGFSGHGFKFCSVIGDIMADLAQHGSTKYDIDLFKLSRFE